MMCSTWPQHVTTRNFVASITGTQLPGALAGASLLRPRPARSAGAACVRGGRGAAVAFRADAKTRCRISASC